MPRGSAFGWAALFHIQSEVFYMSRSSHLPALLAELALAAMRRFPALFLTATATVGHLLAHDTQLESYSISLQYPRCGNAPVETIPQEKRLTHSL